MIESNLLGTELTMKVNGRVDSLTAPQLEEETGRAREEFPHESVVLDVEKMEYISSAGLRVLLKIRKAEPSFRIVGASTEVYEIFEMTGFSEMIPIEKAYRSLSVDGCPVIGRGAKGTVYRYNGDTVVKVYKNRECLPDIQNERELARRAFVLGIPTAISYDIVKVGEQFGSVFELLDAKSYTQLIMEEPDNADRYVREYADLLRQIHSTEVKKEDMKDYKPKVMGWSETVAKYLPEEGKKLEEMISALPDTMNMLHCDYHTNNVMKQNGETLLIDMDTLSHGHPIFELANVYITYVGFGIVNPQMVEKFLGMPYAKSCEVWKKFLPIYLQTEDVKTVSDVENKARILSAARYMHHVVRRGLDAEDEGKQIVAACKREIEMLLPKIDSLTF